MPVAESAATLPGVQTTPGAFTTNFCDKPAPRLGQNLLIVIKVDKQHATAVFHCQTSEHVGSHDPRYVSFLADDDCELHFSNPKVFGKDVHLNKGEQKNLSVSANVKQDETDFYVDRAKTSTFTAATRNPPKIVVP